jgi:hypothetical protein
MGGTPSVSESEFKNLETRFNKLDNKVSDYTTIKQKISDIALNITSQLNDADFAKIATKVPIDNLSSSIINNPGKLGEDLADRIASERGVSVVNRITSGLQNNTAFAKTLSDTLTSDAYPYKKLITGPKGEPGELSSSVDAVKANLYDKKYTMWCADGELCKVPTGVKGIDFGKGLSKIYDDVHLKIESDDNIILQTQWDPKSSLTVNKDRVFVNGQFETENNALVKGGLTVNKDLDIQGVVRGTLNIEGNLVANNFFQPIRKKDNFGKCFDINAGSQNNGINVQIWNCDPNSPQQKIYHTPAKQLVFKHSGKCVDIPGGNQNNGTLLQQYQCMDDNINQKFIYDGQDQMYRWVGNTNKCIDVPNNKNDNGTKLQLWDCNGSDAQRFV